MTRIITEPEVVSQVLLDALPWEHHTGRYRALGHDFAVRATDGVFGHYIERVLHPLRVPGRASSLYSVVDHGREVVPRYSVYLDRDRAFAASEPALLSKLVLWHINQEAVRRTPNHLLIHASAAAHDGRAVLFPAPTESGKTTLVAGLVLAGLDYLTDEATAIDPATCRIEPYPRALSIDPGSWPLLPALEPALPPEFAAFTGAQWQVDPGTIRAGAVSAPADPAVVIALRYEEGAPTRVEPITRSHALIVLGRNAFNLRAHGEAGLDTLAKVVSHCRCYRLVMGRLEEAVDLVLELVGCRTTK